VASEYLVSFGKAMSKHDPEGATAISQSVKGVIAGLLPRQIIERRKHPR
jgi:hypothetical protein